MVSNEQMNSVLGAQELGSARYKNLLKLSESTFAGHWHVNDLPWDTLPLFPFPEKMSHHRLKSFVEFGKQAVKVQLAAEHLATTAARYLLLQAEKENLDYSVRRALAAVLNDEASHVAVMTEMEARAEIEYPDIPLEYKTSPIFESFMDSVPSLYPGLTATFMGAYEAMVAIRGYAEQAAYPRPSILGEMALHAAEDDGRHAKIMRLVGHEWIERFRAETTQDSISEKMKKGILDPIRQFWKLFMHHEFYLLHFDARNRAEWLKRATGDVLLGERILHLVGFSTEELAYLNLHGVMEDFQFHLVTQTWCG